MKRIAWMILNVAVAGWGAAAFGQNVASPSSTSGAEANEGLTEIIVTANRRSESLQDVPITVSAVTADQLTSAAVTNVLDIKSVVPGANVVNANGYINAHLRGVGNSNPGPSIEPAVSLYVDGVYYASTLGVNLDLNNAQEIEVLKGPQGTLFGRNATGGLIQITTRDPSHEPTLDAEIGYGNYQTSKANFYVSGGLTDNLAANFSLQVSHQGEGYGVNLYNGAQADYTDIDIQSRSKFVWRPGEDTTVSAVLDYSHIRQDVPYRLEPGSLPFGPTGPGYGGTPWDTDNDAPTRLTVDTGGASLKAEQDFDFMRLTNIAAYRRTYAHQIFDIDATPVPFQAADAATGERQFSEELQAQSVTDGWLKWTSGVYYFEDVGRVMPAYVEFTSPIPVLNPLYPANGVQVNSEQDTSSIAGYGQVLAQILPGTDLTLGARYTADDHKLIATETVDINLVPLIATTPPIDTKRDFSKATYRASLDHRFSQDFMAYVSYNTGFKSGGFNPVQPTPPVPFLPETLTAYEVGIKTNFLDNRVRADLSWFFYNYRNIQVQELAGENSVATIIANGGGAHVSGLDFDFAVNMTRDFTIHGGMEYLADHFTSFPEAPVSSPIGGIPVSTGSVSGNRLPLAPDVVVDFGGEYKLVQNVLNGSLTLSLAYVYNTGYYMELDNVQHQPHFNDLNGALRWKSIDEHYSASLWANNITNSTIAVFGLTQLYGTHEDDYAPPRTYGVTVGYHF